MHRNENEVTVSELQQKLTEEPGPLLLDVRQPQEFSLCALANATLIPLNQLPARLEELKELAKDREIVAYCHHGVRSMQAVGFLKRAGFAKAQSLAGGIDEWAKVADPSMRRY